MMTWMAHGMCYLWTPWLIWAHVSADALIAVAYFSIPLLLRVLVNQSPARISLITLVPWFIAFIALCGVTHLLDIVVIWHPIYVTQAIVKWITAAVSLGAARELYTVLQRVIRTIFDERHAHLVNEIRATLHEVANASF